MSDKSKTSKVDARDNISSGNSVKPQANVNFLEPMSCPDFNSSKECVIFKIIARNLTIIDCDNQLNSQKATPQTRDLGLTFTMKTVFSLFFVALHLVALAQLQVKLKNGETLTFLKANAEAFQQTANGDTIVIKQLLFDRLDGLAFELSFKPKGISLKQELDFIQYTIDDNPSGSIGLTFWTEFKTLDVSILPGHYGSSQDGFRTFQLLGFESQTELANFYLKSYPELKTRSLDIQRNFFEGLVIDERFKRCCPEYIEQAKEFLNSNPNSFNTFESLSLELVFKSTILEISDALNVQYVRINK